MTTLDNIACNIKNMKYNIRNSVSSIYRVYIELSFPPIMSLFDSCAAVAADGRLMARRGRVDTSSIQVIGLYTGC